MYKVFCIQKTSILSSHQYNHLIGIFDAQSSCKNSIYFHFYKDMNIQKSLGYLTLSMLVWDNFWNYFFKHTILLKESKDKKNQVLNSIFFFLKIETWNWNLVTMCIFKFEIKVNWAPWPNFYLDKGFLLNLGILGQKKVIKQKQQSHYTYFFFLL